LRRAFSGARFEGIRGNVDTRLRKLDGGACDALVLAVAGVKRLGLEHRISAPLPVDVCLPAPGQGIVAVEIAESCTTDVRAAVKRISDADAEAALLAERAVVQALGGGCQMPLGALARADEHELLIDGVVASLDGRTLIRASARGHRGGAAAVGEKLARQLLAKGAAELLPISSPCADSVACRRPTSSSTIIWFTSGCCNWRRRTRSASTSAVPRRNRSTRKRSAI
jgi:hydroxymethylbilane synthase